MSMIEIIKSKNYFKPKFQKKEFNKIFKKSWIFSAMEDELLESNNFVTLEIFGYPIVLQNFKGEIKAFENICPHRNNKIQTEKCGRRPFVCQYHNWAFDSSGKPEKRPLRQLYETESESFNKIEVRNLKVEKVGKFIFVALASNNQPIKDYLGVFYDQLLEISFGIKNKYFFEDSTQNANWKLIIENVLEAYHCPSIHSESLFAMGFCSIPENNQTFFNGHSVADYPKKHDYVEKKILGYLENRVYKHNSFKHFFIFPNLLISSTEGKSIYIGNILPQYQGSSILRKRFYDIKFQSEFEPKEIIHNAYLEMVKTSINKILEEDKVILEQIQKTLVHTKNIYKLSNQEQRILFFHQHYNKLFSD